MRRASTCADVATRCCKLSGSNVAAGADTVMLDEAAGACSSTSQKVEAAEMCPHVTLHA